METLMSSTGKLENFIVQLSQVERKNYIDVFANFDFTSVDLSNLETWSHGEYTRNCIFKNADFEL